MAEVSRNTSDRLAKISDPTKAKPVGMAMITESSEVSLTCSCGGWQFVHNRKKVREDSAQRHLDKKHGGMGIWM